MLFILLNVSCTNNGVETNNEAKDGQLDSSSIQKDDTLNFNLTDSIASLYSGIWINDTYLKKVEDSSSVYKNREFNGILFGFGLDKQEVIQGEAVIYGFTQHEGGLEVPIKWYDNLHCFTSNGQIEEYSAIQTPMDVVVIQSNIIEFQFESSHLETYRKVEDDNTVLREILFEGSYIDSLGNEYHLASNGNAIGFEYLNHYSVLYDFGEGLYFDAIFMTVNSDSDHEKIYHYQIANDTLRLFEVTGEFPEYEIGNLSYELIKQKNG
ncbi:hypothetical protein LVD15_24335 [Fulvivirga maritima]|uniref:hypothetical protein n=1 Tax=Fulvivirga maritima TaxID=2904247 RepID=UPI001F40A140|nr:hypothetical protein [Fulvivirga maritima]UII26389.1 hypothetical protein LVD15_24335 [Fulvivirga maritima]